MGKLHTNEYFAILNGYYFENFRRMLHINQLEVDFWILH